MDEPIPPGSEINWLIFFDKETAPRDIINPILVGLAPAPFTAMGGVSGPHNGLSFVNDPGPGWQPVNVGDQLQWTVHGDNLVHEVL